MKMRKKSGILVVPLITVVLCVAALGGVAYALNNATTSTVEDNPVAGDYYAIDMYSEKTGATVISTTLSADKNFTVYTTKAGIGEQYAAFVNATTLTYKTYVKVTTDIAASTYNATASAVYSAATVLDDNDAPVTLGITSPGTVQFKAIDGSGNPTGDPISVLTGGTVYIMIATFTVTGGAFGSFDTIANLATCLNNFDGTIDISVSATLIDA